MVTKRAAGAATLVILGAMMVLGCMVFTDTSVVKETNDPADWTPRGQDGFDQEISDKKRQDAHVESDFYDDVTPETFQEKEFGLEDSSFEDTDLSLELLQTQSKDDTKKDSDYGVYGTYFGDKLVADEADDKHPSPVVEALADKPGFASNAVTLKVYALAVSGEMESHAMGHTTLDDVQDGSLVVLRAILKGMAMPLGDGETPAKQFEVIMKRLKKNPNWHFEDSIAKGMLTIIDKNMHEDRGILKSFTDHSQHDCADEVSVNNEVGDDVTVSGGTRACIKQMDQAANGQSIEVDAERIGWTGAPPVFSKLAVRPFDFLAALKASHLDPKDVVTNADNQAIAADSRSVSQKDANDLWSGTCLVAGENASNACASKSTAECKAAAACTWSGPWDGSLPVDSDEAYGA